MFLFNRSIKVQAGNLYVPYVVRSVLGIHEGARLYFSRRTAHLSDWPNQLIVSPIPHQLRHEVWSLTASFRDRPGILSELNALLSSLNIDILSCTSTTRDQQRELATRLTLDTQHYESEFDGISTSRKTKRSSALTELEWRISAHFVNDIHYDESGVHQLSIRRNALLSQTVENVEELGNSILSQDGIDIPSNVIERVRNVFSVHYQSNHDDCVLASLVAEIRSRIIGITLFYPNTGHVHVRVEGNDDLATIPTICEELRLAGVNIQQLYSRKLEPPGEVLVDMLVRLPPESDHDRDDAKLKRFVKGTLKNKRTTRIVRNVRFPGLFSKKLDRPKARHGRRRRNGETKKHNQST